MSPVYLFPLRKLEIETSSSSRPYLLSLLSWYFFTYHFIKKNNTFFYYTVWTFKLFSVLYIEFCSHLFSVLHMFVLCYFQYFQIFIDAISFSHIFLSVSFVQIAILKRLLFFRYPILTYNLNLLNELNTEQLFKAWDIDDIASALCFIWNVFWWYFIYIGWGYIFQ